MLKNRTSLSLLFVVYSFSFNALSSNGNEANEKRSLHRNHINLHQTAAETRRTKYGPVTKEANGTYVVRKVKGDGEIRSKPNEVDYAAWRRVFNESKSGN